MSSGSESFGRAAEIRSGAEYSYVRQVPVVLTVVQSVPHHELIRQVKAPVGNGQIVNQPAGSTIKKRAYLQAARIATP